MMVFVEIGFPITLIAGMIVLFLSITALRKETEDD